MLSQRTQGEAKQRNCLAALRMASPGPYGRGTTMSASWPSWQHVFVVYRFDRDRWNEVAPSTINNAITIKEVLQTEEEAAAEIERLETLKAANDCEYYFQCAKLYPNGR